MSDVSLATRSRDSLVADKGVKKRNDVERVAISKEVKRGEGSCSGRIRLGPDKMKHLRTWWSYS